MLNKRKYIIIGIIISLLVIIILFFLYLENIKNQYKEEALKYFDNKESLSTIDDIVYKQELKSKTLNEILKSGKYTFDDPYVELNPYEISPLTALIIFNTKKSENIQVSVNGVYVTTMEKSKEHSIPIFGLKAGIINKVLLQNGAQTHEVKIDCTNVELTNLNIEVKNENAMIDKELYFISSPDNMNASAYDGFGNVIWYLAGKYALDIEFLENGRILLSNNENTGILECYGGFYEMDYLGKIYKNYSLRNGYHHELVRLSDGSTIVLGGQSAIEAPYTASLIYQIDEQGNVLHSVDIYDLFHEIDANFAESLKGTNVLVNSAYYVESSKELILSLRGINSIISLNFENNNINWIFANPKMYSDKFHSYLLNVTDESKYPLGQHTAFLTSDGYLGVFDNGFDMYNESSIYVMDHQTDYSRAVLYQIDDNDIKTYWEYNASQKYFTYALGSFNYYDDKSKLINFGWTFKEDAYQPGVKLITSSKNTYARIIELDAQDQVIFHATYPEGIYRTFKHKLYKDVTENYTDFSFSLINNNLKTNLEKVKTRDIYSLLDGAEENPYDFNITTNSVSMNVFFSDSETVDLYLVSESRDTYILHYKKVNEAPLATINLQIKGNYAVYMKINDVMYDTNKIFCF